MKKETKTKIATTLKTSVLYLSFGIVAGCALDALLIKGLLSVQIYEPYSASTTQEVVLKTQPLATSTFPIAATSTINIGVIREVSAYNSLEAQTDATPCIGADGTDLCKRYQAGECIVASNAYKLGSKIDLQGFGICTVADRMNKRFQNRVDVFMDKDHDRAIKFGLQKLLVAEIPK